MLHKIMLGVSIVGALLSALLLEGFIESPDSVPNWFYNVSFLVFFFAASRAYINIHNADKH